ncbi:MAG: hypothetical protein GDA35_10005, partial [Hyphomonadaceae bacterium]|nr:hypothetical protein [Hyphomonadaceae bacterium]
HSFADQKHRMGLRIRTMGLARATIKITMANMACNIRRLIYHETQRMKWDTSNNLLIFGVK